MVVMLQTMAVVQETRGEKLRICSGVGDGSYGDGSCAGWSE